MGNPPNEYMNYGSRDDCAYCDSRTVHMVVHSSRDGDVCKETFCCEDCFKEKWLLNHSRHNEKIPVKGELVPVQVVNSEGETETVHKPKMSSEINPLFNKEAYYENWSCSPIAEWKRLYGGERDW